MPKSTEWSFPEDVRPRQDEVGFDLQPVLDSVVLLRAEVPEDAFTAPILGTERAGNGVVIRDDGLVLTIGYLITEAESIWLTTHDGRVVPGHPLAYDYASGFGLVVPLGRLAVPALARGSIAGREAGDEVFVVGHGGREHALKAKLIARREFAGYWEYLLEEALFTAPPHPRWSGTALVGSDGLLLGIGSLFVQEAVDDEAIQGNMFVPVDLLEPVLDDMLRLGRPAGPVRPWLGIYTSDEDGRLVIGGLADDGPAQAGGVEVGDVVVEVAGERVAGLADFYRRMWRLGPAGTEVPLTVVRHGALSRLRVKSADRNDLLRKPRLH
jgi:S1-C subfamily serine protease